MTGGAMSNLYAVAVSRYNAQPTSKQHGMISLTGPLVMFTSEHVSDDSITLSDQDQSGQSGT